MKKKAIVAGLLGMVCVLAAPAQEMQRVKSVEPKLEDVFHVMNDLGIHVFRFDLGGFLDAVYEVEGYVAEYKDNRPTGNVHTFQFGNNIRSLDEIPEEHRQGFRDKYQIPAGETRWESIKDMVVCIRHLDEKDSTAVIQFSSADVGSSGKPFKLQILKSFGIYKYGFRPFSLEPGGEKEVQDIPLVLYGSWWEEPGTTICRFCGESEIDPGLQAEMQTDVPHYYVIGLRMKKKN